MVERKFQTDFTHGSMVFWSNLQYRPVMITLTNTKTKCKTLQSHASAQWLSLIEAVLVKDYVCLEH